ncbi:MAG: hypothetical protein L6V93_23320 [Clostridiales bacterium]|nr:MAG: hypothetical protein L6V93_23320 [Clostridiales bacterium]
MNVWSVKKFCKSTDISKLVAKDNSDEDGKAEIGGYSVILTDKNNKPVFNSEITIDKDDNISIRLPKNRLLDFADRTTITVFNTENQTAATGLNIFVTDNNGNNATGVTDEKRTVYRARQKNPQQATITALSEKRTATVNLPMLSRLRISSMLQFRTAKPIPAKAITLL